MYQLFVGMMAEGPSDYSFLAPVIEKTLREMVFQEVNFPVEVQLFKVDYTKSGSFIDYVTSASKNGFEKFGIVCLVIHADADDLSAEPVYTNKITPAENFINTLSETAYCKELAAIIPVFETESWMLANTSLLKKQISTSKTDIELGINGHPESIKRPKEVIEEAIRRGRSELSRKIRNKVTLKDLYSILGASLSIDDLERYDSYKDFKGNIRRVFNNLNLLSNS